ncbi:unnamed protein product [Camellia sinensis]
MVMASKKKPNKAKRPRQGFEQLDRFDSLPWNSSLSVNDDPFSISVGSSELEGGFLSLEEIDQSEYGLEIPKPERENKKERTKENKNEKKRKQSEVEDERGGEVEAVSEEKDNKVKRKKKKKKKKKKNKDAKNSEENEEPTAVTKDDIEGDSVDEAEYYAWNELRLLPLLMKAIYSLGFKEPTPIQKACIPAVAHQGKVDFISIMLFGSLLWEGIWKGKGKGNVNEMMSLGLQRQDLGKHLLLVYPFFNVFSKSEKKLIICLQKRERQLKNCSKSSLTGSYYNSYKRACTSAVTDHLNEVAKGTNFRVVPIVGGMSTEKQERLLKARPKIVVGTPGRLWELMSGGELHLIEIKR